MIPSRSRNTSSPAPSLLSIPPEIRQHIFSYVFADEWIYLSHGSTCYGSLVQERRSGAMCSLLLTSRKLRAEASMSLFKNLTVSCDIEPNASYSPPLSKWLQEIGEDNVSLLRRFNIRWGNYVDLIINLALPTTSTSYTSHLLSCPATGCRPSSASLNSTAADELLQKSEAICTAAGHIGRLETADAPKAQEQDMSSYADAMVININQPTQHSLINNTHHSLPTISLPESTLEGVRASVCVRGIAELNHAQFWERMGTQPFCDMLANVSAKRLESILADRKRPYLTGHEVGLLIAEASQHASGLQWLWAC